MVGHRRQQMADKRFERRTSGAGRQSYFTCVWDDLISPVLSFSIAVLVRRKELVVAFLRWRRRRKGLSSRAGFSSN